MRICLIPLDERPVNTRYPAMLAAISGVELVLPPLKLLPDRRTPADATALRAWLIEQAAQADALIISCETLGYGGLIPSRISDESLNVITSRLEAIGEIRKRHPRLSIYGFSVVTRISNANDNFEEPEYWSQYGTLFWRYSRLADEAALNPDRASLRDELRQKIPSNFFQDFMARRARNHAVNLFLLHAAATGMFDLLVMSSDDTSSHGLNVREKNWLQEWVNRLEIADRVLMYPGADEVGCVLLMRLICAQRQRVPEFAPLYLSPEGSKIIAAYEDMPIDVTFERQVKAIGGRIASSKNAFLCGINTPVPGQKERDPDMHEPDHEQRMMLMESMVNRLHEELQFGRKVVVLDLAYPNGAETYFFDLLKGRIDLSMLTAFAAWNTAGNSIGSALAHAAASMFVQTEPQKIACETFLVHRLVEDWGYQSIVRGALRKHFLKLNHPSEPVQKDLPVAVEFTEIRLNELLNSLGTLASRFCIGPGSVRFPWSRTFEVDFQIKSLT